MLEDLVEIVHPCMYPRVSRDFKYGLCIVSIVKCASFESFRTLSFGPLMTMYSMGSPIPIGEATRLTEMFTGSGRRKCPVWRCLAGKQTREAGHAKRMRRNRAGGDKNMRGELGARLGPASHVRKRSFGDAACDIFSL